MARIYYEKLNSKVKKQIVNKELSVDQVELVFNNVRNNYKTRNKGLVTFLIVVFVMTAFVFVTTIRAKGISEVTIVTLVSILAILIVLVPGIYFLSVRLVPMQFCNALKKGYPELVDTYGMEAIKRK